MAGNFTVHNKFHRSNHHTISASIVDAGMDPIASKQYPFRGIFYNLLTDQERTYNIATNSYDWWSAHTTISAFSGNWMKTQSLYTTVCGTSSNWNLGYSAYTSLCANSANYDSAYTTVCAFSAEWGSPYLMFTNKVQEYTHAKTFSGVNLVSNGIPSLSVYQWNLDTQQVAFIRLNQNIKIENPEEGTIINGGLYTLVFLQDNTGVANDGYEVEFDSQYRFNTSLYFTDIVSKALSAVTVINFLAINNLLYGDVVVVSAYP